MTTDEFFKYHWKAMEVVEWHNPRTNETAQCVILMVDFDCHTMKLVPVDEIGYEQKEFYCSIDLIRKIPKRNKDGSSKLKLA